MRHALLALECTRLPLAQQQHELQRLGKHGHILTGRKPARARPKDGRQGKALTRSFPGPCVHVHWRVLPGHAGQRLARAPAPAQAQPTTTPPRAAQGQRTGGKVAGRGWVRESMKESEFLTM